jgi:hypothetical protein
MIVSGAECEVEKPNGRPPILLTVSLPSLISSSWKTAPKGTLQFKFDLLIQSTSIPRILTTSPLFPHNL